MKTTTKLYESIQPNFKNQSISICERIESPFPSMPQPSCSRQPFPTPSTFPTHHPHRAQNCNTALNHCRFCASRAVATVRNNRNIIHALAPAYCDNGHAEYFLYVRGSGFGSLECSAIPNVVAHELCVVCVCVLRTRGAFRARNAQRQERRRRPQRPRRTTIPVQSVQTLGRQRNEHRRAKYEPPSAPCSVHSATALLYGLMHFGKRCARQPHTAKRKEHGGPSRRGCTRVQARAHVAVAEER